MENDKTPLQMAIDHIAEIDDKIGVLTDKSNGTERTENDINIELFTEEDKTKIDKLLEDIKASSPHINFNI